MTLSCWCSDQSHVSSLLSLPVSGLSDTTASSSLYQLLSLPARGMCRSLVKVGGVYDSRLGSVMGDMAVCLDNDNDWLDKCLVYSIGATDWTWEEEMEHIGCTIAAFNHKVS